MKPWLVAVIALGSALIVAGGMIVAALVLPDGVSQQDLDDAVNAMVVASADGNGRSDETRGMVVRLGSRLGYGSGDTPWCSEFHHFCVSNPRDGEPLVAFYTFTTHEGFRQNGCEVRWVLRGEVSDAMLSRIGDASGAYREGCGGAMFDRLGTRIFGPAARDLDQFPVEVTDSEILVDTRVLICGTSPPGESNECDFAPRVD